jgi:hypothetical protein
MQIPRFVRTLVLPLTLGLAGFVVGCGPGAGQGAPAEVKEARRIHAEGNRKFHEQLQADAKAKKPASKGKFRQ